MKYPTIRKAKGYCCIWCDGPYNVWKKKTNAGRRAKRSDNNQCRKEIDRQRSEE